MNRMSTRLPHNVQSCVESICELGCDRVNEIIALLEAEKPPAEVCKLDQDERRAVLCELKAIMAVYDQKPA
jgi:hypothetical protein